MNDDAKHWNRLARYLAGEATEDELAAVQHWLSEDDRRPAELEALRRGWTRAAELPGPERVEALWCRLSETLARDGADGARQGRERGVRVPRVQAAVAAALILCLAGAAAWWVSSSRSAANMPPATQEFSTTLGQRASVTLIDGTRVTLGPGSRMRVAVAERGPREVNLEGEAVFDVVHDSARVFVVRAGPAMAEDLGTRFLVRAYTGEPVKVMVAEGVVAVRDTTPAAPARAVLTERDLAVMTADGGLAVEHGVDPAEYLAWMEGRLVFRHAPLREVLVQIERWYDVEIVVADSALLATTVNAAFGERSVDGVMKTLASLLDVRVERHGRLVSLRGR